MKILGKKTNEPPETEEYLREAFRTFDKDGSGVIGRVEMQQIMSNQGEKLSEHEVQEMMADADDGKGEIHYEGIDCNLSFRLRVISLTLTTGRVSLAE